MRYVERIRVRYNECDMQNVVFNANYWMYADDAVAQWMRHAIAAERGEQAGSVNLAESGFDFMLKTVPAHGTAARRTVTSSTRHVRCRGGATRRSTWSSP